MYEAFERAISSAERIIKRIDSSQFDKPTPCSEWDVHEVLNHMIGTLWLHEALLTDSESRYPMAPGQQPDTDLVGDDPVASCRTAANAALAVMREGVLEQPHQTPMGQIPGEVLAGFTTTDMYVHSWDLARATGQDDAVFDEELGERIFGFARQALTPDKRGRSIGQEVEVAGDAPLIDRLVGFLGRTP